MSVYRVHINADYCSRTGRSLRVPHWSVAGASTPALFPFILLQATTVIVRNEHRCSIDCLLYFTVSHKINLSVCRCIQQLPKTLSSAANH